MRILLITPLFQPEPNHLKGLAFVKRLREEGHDVEVLTGFPHYPGGRVYDGYKIRPIQREVREGIPITRVALYPSHDNSALRRFLTYLTFALSATVAGALLFRRYDIVHVCQGPATLVVPGLAVAFVTRAKLVLDIQDIWPESVSSSGMLCSSLLLRILGAWSKFTYRVADAIIVLSYGYKRTICMRGAQRRKVHLVYNWSDESIESGQTEAPEYFHCLRSSGKWIILFAGTMGRVQALDAVIDAAELLQSTNGMIHFAFVGGGVDVDRLKSIATKKGLANVSFLPRVEGSVMKSIFSCADALLIHLRRDFLGKIGIPQKTQAYLAAGKPIIMAVNGEAADIVKAANAGIVCTPENPLSIATAIRDLFVLSSSEREELGQNGQRYYRENMSFEIGVRNVTNVYLSVLNREVELE
jgi:colanic acid biosynthesis glycosyl transferase WcaI